MATLAIPTQVVSSLLNGLAETWLIRRGWAAIDIRRRSSTLGYAIEAALTLVNAWAPTARVAHATSFVFVLVGPLHQARRPRAHPRGSHTAPRCPLGRSPEP